MKCLWVALFVVFQVLYLSLSLCLTFGWSGQRSYKIYIWLNKRINYVKGEYKSHKWRTINEAAGRQTLMILGWFVMSVNVENLACNKTCCFANIIASTICHFRQYVEDLPSSQNNAAVSEHKGNWMGQRAKSQLWTTSLLCYISWSSDKSKYQREITWLGNQLTMNIQI